MKQYDHSVLIKQLVVFVGVIGVSYTISSLLPRFLLLSSVSWNLRLF